MQQLPMTFDLQSEIAKANAEQLENRPLVWGVDMTIPAFLLKREQGQFYYMVPNLTRKDNGCAA